MYRRTAIALVVSSALVSCGAAAPLLTTPIPAPDVVAALDVAHRAHPGAVPYAVDLLAEGGKCRMSVWMLEGGDVHGVHLDVERGGALAFDETAPIAAGAVTGVPALVEALSARELPLRRGAGWMFARYGLGEVRTVELEMHGSALVLEAVLGDGEGATIHVHDPDDGRYLMTEVGVAPGPAANGT